MKRTLLLALAPVFVVSVAAAAPGPVTSQSTAGAQNMNNALRKLSTQHVPILEQSLKDRNMPKSVVSSPSRILKSTQQELKAPLELGLTGEPAVAQGAATSLEVRGNGNSSTLKRVQVTSTTGNIQGIQPTQHIQMTSDNSPPAQPVAPRPYRDPRMGIQMNDQAVIQWHTTGNGANPNLVMGDGKIRTIRPLSPGMMFRGAALPAGSHLVTVQTGTNANMSFNGQPAPVGLTPVPNNAASKVASMTYLLKARADGNFDRVKLTAQEATDLAASQPQRSYTIKGGTVQDNIAPGYDQQSLRAGGFVQ